MSGQTFSHYRLDEPLGEGGMGIVFRAEDTTLGRPVAVKFLRSRTIEDQGLRTRFIREARLAASINHPNICTIYEVGEVTEGISLLAGARADVVPAGTPFIAMELVVGETLHERLMRAGRLPLKELLAIGVQIAEGMQEAHARRIVHRDLKPRNVVIDGAGRVKILDFGLAKPLDRPRPDDAVMVDAQTQSAELTRMGGIVGTVAYMSPEQAQGKSLDSRSDLFSFGVMLYELATGRRPFDGSSPTSTITKILETEPRPIRETVPHLPSDLDRIVRRCLQKNPADRYHDARDLVLDLKDLQQTLSSGIGAAGGAASQRQNRSTIAVVAAVAAMAGLAVAFVLMRGRPAPPVIPAMHRQITFSGNVSAPAISPDGKFIAYVTGGISAQRVVVQDLAGGQRLDVYTGRYIRALTWSPDGSELAFGAGTSPSSFAAALMIVPRLGGTPRRLVAPSTYVAWSPIGRRIASASGVNSISITDKATGQTTSFRLAGSFAFFGGLDWDRSGRGIAFATAAGDEGSKLWSIGVDGTGQRLVLEAQSTITSPRWSAAGDAVYFMKSIQGGTELWKVAIDQDGRAAGTEHLVLGGLPLGGVFTLARDGTQLAYTRTVSNSNLWLVTIDPRTASPARLAQLTSGTLSDTRPAISPDGTRVAFSRQAGDKTDIFSIPIDGGSPQQMTFVANAGSPSWSPDGNKVAFISLDGGKRRIWSANSAGGPPRVFAKTEASGLTEFVASPIAWGAKGTILYQRPGNRMFHVLDPTTEREVALAKDESVGWMYGATYSPDETRVAVYWNRPPQRGIWILSPATGAEDKVYDGYAFPAGWSPDGLSVYAVDLSNSNSPRLLSIRVREETPACSPSCHGQPRA
jgi:eukaryotic-like serine/threonine-protein kinase